MTRHSPCVGVCKLDDKTGYCRGCGRTGTEVADWIALTEGERDEVWLRLPDRLRALSIGVRLLPWTPDEIRLWAAGTLVSGAGTWYADSAQVFGFAAATAADLDVEAGQAAITAKIPGASFRLRTSEKLRAFAIRDDHTIILALPKRRAALARRLTVAQLGRDADAISDDCREQLLFDLGVGNDSCRFCIRVSDEHADCIASRVGSAGPELLAFLTDRNLLTDVACIYESVAARIEATASAGSLVWPPASRLISALPEFAAPVAIFHARTGKSS